MKIKINPNREDIRHYLDALRNKFLKINLKLNRTPFEYEPKSGTLDEYSLIYNIMDESFSISEMFISINTKNLTDLILKKGEIIENVNPIDENALIGLWAQVGYRLDFIKKRKIPFNIYHFNEDIINLDKKLPSLPYRLKLNLTLKEVMDIAKEKYIDYCREELFTSESPLENYLAFTKSS